LEWQQFGGSVKARVAFNIIREAVKSGSLGQGQHLLDASTGNTGIAYAIFAAVAGIPLTLCIPANATDERKNVLDALNVNVVYTPSHLGPQGAHDVAKKIKADKPEEYFFADQYSNAHNWQSHYHETGAEIWEQTEGKVSHFLSGIGTGGTLVGVSKKLKEFNKKIQMIGLQPKRETHGLDGWVHLESAGHPKVYDEKAADSMMNVSTEEAHQVLKDLAEKEGLMVSPSAAANLKAALDLANGLEEGVVVTIFPDDASKYSNVIASIFNFQG
ncbi:MAG: PLP-dependent cysteine synthase family protein, partial [Flavobacteriales bacterium]